MMQQTEDVLAVRDPGLEIRGAFRPQFGLKVRPGPSPRSATVWYTPQPISGGDALMLLCSYALISLNIQCVEYDI